MIDFANLHSGSDSVLYIDGVFKYRLSKVHDVHKSMPGEDVQRAPVFFSWTQGIFHHCPDKLCVRCVGWHEIGQNIDFLKQPNQNAFESLEVIGQ